MDNEVAEARARLAAKFGKVQLGGKGTSSTVNKIITFACQALLFVFSCS